jgi:hypothetical protein
VTGRRGRRRRELLDELKERKGYCHLKEEALDRTMYKGSQRGTPLVAQLVAALRYKPEGRGFDSRWCHWKFFIDISSGRAMALG